MPHTYFTVTVALLLAAAITLLLLSQTDQPDESSTIGIATVRLAHGTIQIRASSFPPTRSGGDNFMAALAAAAAGVTAAHVASVSDDVFHKSKFALHGSHANGSSASFSTRKLHTKHSDIQFFVQFSSPTDVVTLAAFSSFSGHRVIAHVHDDLYVTIASPEAAVVGRSFPGVAWLQERDPGSKVGTSLKLQLQAEVRGNGWMSAVRRLLPALRSSTASTTTTTTIIAQCWYDGCGTSGASVKSICPDVYVHPTLVEVSCPTEAVQRALLLLTQHPGIDHVDVKQRMVHKNFGGRQIVGAGPSATPLSSSLFLSSVSVNNSIIAFADTGIDMNNCFFYDSAVPSFPWTNSRVVSQYTFQDCSKCGRCCNAQSPAGCTNAANACGNQHDQDGHGTHVGGTIAGSGPASVSYANGIAAGAKIYFQDIENVVPVDQCYSADSRCTSLYPSTDVFNLFTPALQAGAFVHSNSWGCKNPFIENDPYHCNTYSSWAQGIDAFTSENPQFLVVMAAGNDGDNAFSQTVGSPATCKNCLSVGASQQSDDLLRSMQPYVDPGYFCRWVGSTESCCSAGSGRGLSCVNKCCSWINNMKYSMACCNTETTCFGGPCSVASGNIRSPLNVAHFSSRGTTASDARIKPDLVAPGEEILSAFGPGSDASGQLIATLPNHCVIPSQSVARDSDSDANRALQIQSGTSMATPLTAGAIERIRQYFVQGYYPLGTKGTGQAFVPDESLVRAVVLASCQPLSGTGGVLTATNPLHPQFSRYPIPQSLSPNIFSGFGLPVLDQAVTLSNSNNGYRMLFATSTTLPSSTPAAFTVTCTPSSPLPLKLVLVWTDPPGSLSSRKQLVNDLDLIVLVRSATLDTQLFGNMRTSPDAANTVERVVTSCPSSGSVTAIVTQGDVIKTASQKWYLVANGPVSSISAPLSVVPAFSTGRISPPAFQDVSCLSATTLTAKLWFMPKMAWVGESWDVAGTTLEFTSALTQVARVDGQAISIALDQGGSSATMTLRCSVFINSYSYENGLLLKYVSPDVLLSYIKTTCAPATSACTTDPVIGSFNWTAFSTGETPHLRNQSASVSCSSLSSCSACTQSPHCGWCTSSSSISSPSQGLCKAGISAASSDGSCVKAGGNWSWSTFDCSALTSVSPLPPPSTSPPTSTSPPADEDGAAVCTECPPGTYSTLVNSSSFRTCVPCPFGTYSPNTSASSVSACIRCPAGSYPILQDSDASSTAIEVGMQSEYDTNRTVRSLVLDYGRCFARHASQILLEAFPVPSSYMLPKKCNSTHIELLDCTDATCTKCISFFISLPLAAPYTLKCVGSVDMNRGASACALCPSGTFSTFPNATSATACLLCPIGTVALPGSSVCRPCSSGFYVGFDGATPACFKCPPGFVSTATASSSPTNCLPCGTGSYANANATACLRCPVGTSSSVIGAATSSLCAPCTPGSFSPVSGAASCIPCALGTASALSDLSTNCSACPAGTFSAALGSSICSSCPAGTFSRTAFASSSAACVACASGSVSSAGSSACVSSCPMGSYRVAVTCIPCPPGTFSTTFNASAASVCIPCKTGTFSSNAGANRSTACVSCPAGTFSSTIAASSPCQPCPASTYSSIIGANSSVMCQTCPVGQASPPSSSSPAACTQCPKGSYHNSEFGHCMLCPSGTFAMNPGSLSCASCPDGTTSPIGSSTCTYIPPPSPVQNLAVSTRASVSLPSADVAALSQPRDESSGTQVTVLCPSGAFFIAEAPLPKCALCWANHTSDTEGRSCLPCPSGSAASIGDTSCSKPRTAEAHPLPPPTAPLPQKPLPTPQLSEAPEDKDNSSSSPNLVAIISACAVVTLLLAAAAFVYRRHNSSTVGQASEAAVSATTTSTAKPTPAIVLNDGPRLESAHPPNAPALHGSESFPEPPPDLLAMLSQPDPRNVHAINVDAFDSGVSL